MSIDSHVAEVDPVIETLRRHDEGLKSDWLGLKYEQMGRDMFSFFRGANPLFAAGWPTTRPADPGPELLICGDLHLENFGAYRADDGAFVFDVNDFDEAAVAPVSYDLVRCSTSIFLAAQVWKLSPIQATRMILGYLDNYRRAVAESAGVAVKQVFSGEHDSIADLLDGCALATQAELLEAVTRVDHKTGERSFRRCSGRLPALGKAKAEMVALAVEQYGRSKGSADACRVLDVAGRVAGIGSLGVRRYAVLVAGDGTPEGNRVLDIKQAIPSALAGIAEPCVSRTWLNDAERVVEAQRVLQGRPTAGLDVIEVDDQAFRVRELIPEENRARLDRFRRKPSLLRQAVEVAGRVTAWSHLRAAKLEPVDKTRSLAGWAAGPALEAVMAAAIRQAGRTRDEFKAFRKAKSQLDA